MGACSARRAVRCSAVRCDSVRWLSPPVQCPRGSVRAAGQGWRAGQSGAVHCAIHGRVAYRPPSSSACSGTTAHLHTHTRTHAHMPPRRTCRGLLQARSPRAGQTKGDPAASFLWPCLFRFAFVWVWFGLAFALAETCVACRLSIDHACSVHRQRAGE